MATALQTRKAESILDELDRMHQRIVQRAHDIFELGGTLGRDLDDWLQAERELVWKPAIELAEKDNEFHLQIAAAGVDPKDLEIEVTPQDILVKAELRHQHTEKKGTVHTCEFAAGNLFRAIHLPRRIDPEKVKAEFKDGMLNLKAPIAEEARARKVKIEAA
jgi:HSP20 family protein